MANISAAGPMVLRRAVSHKPHTLFHTLSLSLALVRTLFAQCRAQRKTPQARGRHSPLDGLNNGERGGNYYFWQELQVVLPQMQQKKVEVTGASSVSPLVLSCCRHRGNSVENISTTSGWRTAVVARCIGIYPHQHTLHGTFHFTTANCFSPLLSCTRGQKNPSGGWQ
ncbi:unnamed protein product [Ectocarpus sp. 12 AP-2014]